MNKHIRIRRDIAANWTEHNPVLRQGEVGYVLDNYIDESGVRYYVTKIGDGDTAWNDLPRASFAPKPAGGGGGGSVAWADITSKPTEFTPSAHTHGWSEITSKPSTFAPSAHSHAISEVTGLQTELDGKASSTHSHAWSEITSKPTEFTPAAHTHAISDVTLLPESLATLAEAVESKAERQDMLDGDAALQSAINGKANASHTHAISEVTGLQSALDGKLASTTTFPIITTPQSNLTAGLVRYQNVGASGTPLTSWGTAEGVVPRALAVVSIKTRCVMGSAVAGSAAKIELFAGGSVVATVTIPIGSTTGIYEATITTPIAVANNSTWYWIYTAPSGSAIQINNVTIEAR